MVKPAHGARGMSVGWGVNGMGWQARSRGQYPGACAHDAARLLAWHGGELALTSIP
jgi:hypothetical protein